MTSPYRETASGVVLTVHVQPGARRNAYAGLHGDALKFRIAAPPVEGAANAALCAFLADLCGVPKSAVRVESGQTGRRKRVLVKDRTSRQIRAVLERPSDA